VDVVVPVFNEEACIDAFITRMAAIGLPNRLIFVDNASSDATVARIERHADVTLIRHERNLGYGASIRDGLRASTAPFVVVIDADLEYPPEAIPDMLQALSNHPVVYGSRFAGRAAQTMPWLRRAGNAAITTVFNVLFAQQLSDLYTGMKAFRREVLQDLALRRDGFDHVVEVAVDLARAGHRIGELAIVYAPRATGTSKMRHVRETLRGLRCLVGAWVSPRVASRP
jgi:glycosyltransferase involved in cell wall biosynthesis